MKNRQAVRTLIVVPVLVLCNCAGNSIFESSSWRTPYTYEINDEWRSKGIDSFLVARGDFNGDGVRDTARFLIRKNRTAFGLFVFVSQKNNTVKAYLLDEDTDIRRFHAMGVETVPSGLYMTACGKGYWQCRKTEEVEISIPYDAINYFKIESANSYYYWDNQGNVFKKVWISD